MDYHEIQLLIQLNQENRFGLQKPPVPTNPSAFDRYAYSFNNPIHYTDPSGHTPILAALCLVSPAGWAVIGAVVVAGVVYYAAGGPEAVGNAMYQAGEGIRSVVKASGPKPLTPDEQKHTDKLTKGIDDFLENHPDLSEEAERVADGETLPKGADHVEEAKQFAKGLENSINHLKSVRGKRTPEAQKVIDQAIEHAQEQLEYLHNLLGDW